MDLEQLEILKKRIINNSENTLSEEGTKTAFILPLIKILGYDVFDPTEVVPEYTSDFGIKKGEKVDYAIIINKQPVILVEAKKHKEKLDLHGSQLFRYFSVSKSRLGILTNGIEYEFYSDLEKENIMDDVPFLKFNILSISQNDINELSKIQKDNFNIDEIVSSASNLKYSNKLYDYILEEFKTPSDEFIKFIVSRFYDGRVTSKVIDKFKSIFNKTIDSYINNIISKRLNLSSLNIIENEYDSNIPKINTTLEEVEAYTIIKTLLSYTISPDRISYRDAQSYMAIILDNNNRKTICRLYFNSNNKFIAILDKDKKETRHKIINNNDIFDIKEDLIRCISELEI
jgi:hypothetical protein